jgi:DNA-binding response OmpR family regulator
MNALVVTRSEARRNFVSRALGPDWTIHEVSNGREAVTACREDAEIAVVIADETTEPFGAFGLARELTNLEDAPEIILLLDRAQDTWLAKWSRADRWLVEPIDPFELAEGARALWAQRIHRAPA